MYKMDFVSFLDKNINKEQFSNIFKAWNNNESSSDIYHLILEWINDNNNKLIDKTQIKLVQDIKKRMVSNDETTDIVDDFINGSKYQYLRKSMLK